MSFSVCELHVLEVSFSAWTCYAITRYAPARLLHERLQGFLCLHMSCKCFGRQRGAQFLQDLVFYRLILPLVVLEHPC